MDVLSDKKVKVRKQHICFGCCEVIPQGTEGIRKTDIANEGDVYTNYLCARCDDWVSENTDHFQDEWYQGDVKEDMDACGKWEVNQ